MIHTYNSCDTGPYVVVVLKIVGHMCNICINELKI